MKTIITTILAAISLSSIAHAAPRNADRTWVDGPQAVSERGAEFGGYVEATDTLYDCVRTDYGYDLCTVEGMDVAVVTDETSWMDGTAIVTIVE